MNFGNVMIFGDSYSTYAGCIPKGYATYYSPEGDPNSDHTVKKTFCNICKAVTIHFSFRKNF